MQSSTNKDKNKNKIMFFFNSTLVRNFFFVEVRAFTVVVLKILFIFYSKFLVSQKITLSILNTPNVKYFILLSLHLK